jgi:hypothetical protein
VAGKVESLRCLKDVHGMPHQVNMGAFGFQSPTSLTVISGCHNSQTVSFLWPGVVEDDSSTWSADVPGSNPG